MDASIFVFSTDGLTTYKLDAHFEDEKLNLYCNCQAGSLGKLCKHKLAIAGNDWSTVAEETNLDSQKCVKSWVSLSGYEQLVIELTNAEKSEKEAKENVNMGVSPSNGEVKSVMTACAAASAQIDLDINNVRATLLNGHDRHRGLRRWPVPEAPA